MSDSVPLTASRLRQAMRDPRYWQSGHPERTDYRAWVSDGWRQLQTAESQPNSDGLIWVRPYTRTRDGETEQVSGHYRNASGSMGADPAYGGRAGTVTVQDQPRQDVERRYTALNGSGGLIGRCERLTDGSQFCTLAMPDGSVAVQQLRPGESEFTPIAAPAIAAYGLPLLLGVATSLYNHLLSQRLASPGGDVAPDTPFLLFYRGFEGSEADVNVTVGSLRQDRVNEFCPKTSEFEARLAESIAATPREGMTPQQ